MRLAAFLPLLLATCAPVPAMAAMTPRPASCPVVSPGTPTIITIERVKDGDTFRGTCKDRFGFPEDYRLNDLDTPEKGPLAKCEREAARAKAATAYVEDLARRAGMRISAVIAPHKEKYGRYLTDATFTIAGKKVVWREALIEAGFALPYDGGKKADWCAILRGPENLLPATMETVP